MKVYVKDRDLHGIKEINVKADSLVDYLEEEYRNVRDNVRILVINKQTYIVRVYAVGFAEIVYSTNYKSALNA